MIKILFYLILIPNCIFGQKVFIKDENLKNYLKGLDRGFIVNDSLDLASTNGWLHLLMPNKSIKDLAGIENFKNALNLNCSDNEIRKLYIYPPRLQVINCNNNKIDTIINLPQTIQVLSCSGNELRELPKLPKKMTFLNYANNPIDRETLPADLKQIPCDRPGQNCLSKERTDHPNLYQLPSNVNIKSIKSSIKSIDLELNFDYGWGYWDKVNYKYNINADKKSINLKRKKISHSKNRLSNNTYIGYYNDYKFSGNLDVLLTIIEGVLQNQFAFQISDFNLDSLFVPDIVYDFSNFRYAQSMSYYSDLVDGGGTFFTLTINYEKDKTIALRGQIGKIQPHYTYNLDYVAIAEWIYNFQIFNYLFPGQNLINENIYNKSNLKELLDFYNNEGEARINSRM